VPTEQRVLEALTTLRNQGMPEHMGLLHSLAMEEHGLVQLGALQAVESVAGRIRTDLRLQFAHDLPGDSELYDWLRLHRTDVQRADGTHLGTTERQVLAYAALVLGDVRARPEPEQYDGSLIDAATRSENAGDAREALRLYAWSASLGEPTAWTHIEAFGVDPERLLLGMSTSDCQALPSPLDDAVVDLLVSQGSTVTLQVMAERSTSTNDRTRTHAVDALGRMLRAPNLGEAERTVALDKLHHATMDPSNIVRVTARSALLELPGSHSR
jgi:hypothetical protein